MRPAAADENRLYGPWEDGLRLFWQACICPAAVLAANASLLAGEQASPQAHNIPCTSGFAIGPKGLEVYQRICRSQLTCGLICMGLPILYTENLIQRQKIRDKYGLHHPSSCSEIGAGCCYPFSLFQSHVYLFVHRLKQTTPELAPGNPDCHGPLRLGLLAARRNIGASGRNFELGTSQPGSQGQSMTPVTGCTSAAATAGLLTLDTEVDDTKDSTKSAAARRHFPREPSAMSRVGPASAQTAIYGGGGGGSATAGSVHGGGGSAAADGSCVGETGGASQDMAPSESIPLPEVTDSPRMGLAAAVVAASSYVASTASLQDSESVLDSDAFLGPVQPPMMAPLRPPPPRVEAAPKQPPPSSKDSRVVAARTQGAKVAGASQVQQHSAAGSRSRLSDQSSLFQSGRSRPSASAAQPTMSDSESSAFSLPPEPSPAQQHALNTSSKRTVTAVTTTGGSGTVPLSSKSTSSSSHTVIAAPAAPAVALTVAMPPTPHPAPSTTPSSNDMRGTHDTITSSKLSSMIDHAMLNGSGASGARGSGGTPGSGETTVPWDSCRHSVMAPIAEAEAEECPPSSASGQQRAVMPSSSQGRRQTAATAAVEPGAPSSHGLAANANVNASFQKAQRASRGSGSLLAAIATTNLRAGVSISRASGGKGAGVSGTAAGGLNGAALTVLARMGTDCGSHSSSGGTGTSGSKGQQRAGASSQMRSGNNLQQQGNASLQRRTLAPSSTQAISLDATRSASSSHGTSPSNAASTSTSRTLRTSGPRMTAAATSAVAATCTDPEAQRHPAPGCAPQPTTAPYTAGLTYICDEADDAVNMASIVPSLVDGPEMGSVREALRCAGEQADALAAVVPPSDSSRQLPSSTCPAPTQAAAAMLQSGSSTTPSTQRLLTLPLAPTMTAGGLPRNAIGGGRYGSQGVLSATAAAAATASPALAVSAAASAVDQYASYCEEGGAPWHSDVGGSGDGEEDASSAIDGPVSSGEQDGGASGGKAHHMKGVSQEAVSRPVLHYGVRMHGRAPYEPGSPEAADEEADKADDGDGYVDCCDEEEDDGISGDACVSVMLTGPGRGLLSGDPVATGDIATGGDGQLARPSISGLSNGGSTGGRYEGGGGDGATSVGDSVAASQHRQKHWINWMAQSVVSVGVSYANSSRTMQQMPYRPVRQSGLSGGGGAGSGTVTERVRSVGVSRGGAGQGSADHPSGGGGGVSYERWG